MVHCTITNSIAYSNAVVTPLVFDLISCQNDGKGCMAIVGKVERV